MQLPADEDAALVTAVLRRLRHLDDPERDTTAGPRTRAGWVREVLRALRSAGVELVLPPPATAGGQRTAHSDPDHGADSAEMC